MSSIGNVLAGRSILVQVKSPINGQLTVVRDIAWGTYIKAGGVTQSGGVANKVWNTVLKIAKKRKHVVSKCLVLGLGGGGIVSVVKRYWKDAKIVGVDVDSVIVELGKKYLGLDPCDVEIVIDDAVSFLRRNSKKGEGDKKGVYDLICNDVYVGTDVPEKFTKEGYIKNLKNNLAKDGIAIFNRLYYGEKRAEALQFGKKLEKYFSEVKVVYPEANVMFLCER